MTIHKPKQKLLQPIAINKDTWFYVNPKTIHFTSWSEYNDDGTRKVVSFLVKKSLLKKYFK